MNGIFLTFTHEIYRIVGFILEAFAHTWPMWIISIPLAAIIKMSTFSDKLKRIFSMNPIISVLLATAVGAVSPLCSCSVVPVIFSLLSAGVPIAPVMSFWLASPSMDPEIFFLSISSVGWPLAIARLVAATLMSLFGGFLAIVLEKNGYFSHGLLRNDYKNAGSTCGCTHPKEAVPCCGKAAATVLHRDAVDSPALSSAIPGSADCQSKGPSRDYRKLASRFGHELLSSVGFVAKFMAIAFLLEALIKFYVPEQWIRMILGSDNAFAIPTAVLVGIPFYTTNAQALGMVGGLLGKGMGEGAALAFLIGGATTTLPAMAAVFGIAKPRVFIVYLGSAIMGALASGLVWAAFF